MLFSPPINFYSWLLQLVILGWISFLSFRNYKTHSVLLSLYFCIPLALYALAALVWILPLGFSQDPGIITLFYTVGDFICHMGFLATFVLLWYMYFAQRGIFLATGVFSILTIASFTVNAFTNLPIGIFIVGQELYFSQTTVISSVLYASQFLPFIPIGVFLISSSRGAALRAKLRSLSMGLGLIIVALIFILEEIAIQIFDLREVLWLVMIGVFSGLLGTSFLIARISRAR